MHSLFSRINNVSALLSSCMMALLATIALSSLVFTADPKGDLEIASVKVYVSALCTWLLIRFWTRIFACLSDVPDTQQINDDIRRKSRSWPLWTLTSVPVRLFNHSDRPDVYALLVFTFSSDLTPLFNWNTKQLFLYLEAEYTNAQGVSFLIKQWFWPFMMMILASTILSETTVPSIAQLTILGQKRSRNLGSHRAA